MKKFFNSTIGFLRVLGLLEGTSLIVLVFIGVPVKRFLGDDTIVKTVGMAHGILFILFVFLTLLVGQQQRWKIFQTTWKVLLSCIIPFGTFYVDHKILKPIHQAGN